MGDARTFIDVRLYVNLGWVDQTNPSAEDVMIAAVDGLVVNGWDVNGFGLEAADGFVFEPSKVERTFEE